MVGYVFVSCKKSDKKTTQLTVLQRIQAKWGIESVIDHEHLTAGFDTTVTSAGTASDYVDFRSDGKVYFSFGGTSDTTTYALVGDTSILIQLVGTYKIQTLTDNQLKLYTKEEDASGYLEEYLNLKK